MFIGVTVPLLRQVGRECRDAAIPDLVPLLGSAVHEERLLALLLLVEAFKRGTEEKKREIYQLYLGNTKFINNSDLVDSSAPHIVGGWLFTRSRSPLRRLARSSFRWERRIGIIATQFFIRSGDFERPFESPTCCWPTATI